MNELDINYSDWWMPTAPVSYASFPFTSASVIQKCVAMCMDRYMDSFNLVSRVYAERLRRESGNM